MIAPEQIDGMIEIPDGAEEIDRMIAHSNAVLLRTLDEERRRSADHGDLTAEHRVILDRILAKWNDDRAELGMDPISRAHGLMMILCRLAELLEISTEL